MSIELRLKAPEVDGQRVRFRWDVAPSDAPMQSGFTLEFPPAVDPAAVPSALWWRILLICLHGFWPVLRPVRIHLPVALPPGERELWLRLTDAAVATLEAMADGTDISRTVELVDQGLPLEPLSSGARSGVVACFSGGRDGLTQAAMLDELGEAPLLVCVTDPLPGLNDHRTPRRAEVLRESRSRLGLELVEVHCDLRTNVRGEPAHRYGMGINELVDTHLYIAVAVAVAAARGRRLVTIASETEVQENDLRHGAVVRAPHFMYSGVTLQALSAVVAPAGITVSSLTHPLSQFQVQRLLATRYPNLRDLQYSCWSMSAGQAACSACAECREIALNLLSGGVSPAAAGIDVVQVLDTFVDWEPGTRYLRAERPPEFRVLTRSGRATEMQAIRALRAVTSETLSSIIDGEVPAAERDRAVARFSVWRRRAEEVEVDPEPGYASPYLEMVDPALAAGVRGIIEQHFEPAPEPAFRSELHHAQQLIRWITRPHVEGVRSGPRSTVSPAEHASRVPAPARLDSAEMSQLGSLVPDPEPPLLSPPGRDAIPVADTRLDGREAEYVAECVRSGWISSAGAYVRRLEAEFAARVGCRHAVACSSGTAALHLAYAACGLGPDQEVVLPAFTMIATAQAAAYTGAEVELADAATADWNVDPAQVIEKLSGRTRALAAVHTYGLPADMERLAGIARANDLWLIEDAAQAHGATLAGRPAGSLGDVAAFSLYANKIMTSGEGGLLSTDHDDLAAAARELRDHAFTAERHFWHRRRGFNYRMTNLQAAIALAQLERLDELVAQRGANAERYREALDGIPGLGLPPQRAGAVPWMFGVTVEAPFGRSRDDLRRRLAARGVETRAFFVPLHIQPVLRERFRGQRFPVAERLGATGLYLPSGPGLRAADIRYVVDAVRAESGVSPSSR